MRVIENEELVNELDQTPISFCGPSGPEWADTRGGFDPKWATETVRTLAKGIEANQAFDRMSILADAFEEAGCDEPVLLGHCRVCPTHSPHCWVLRMIREAAVVMPAVASRLQDPPLFSAPLQARRSTVSLWAVGTLILCFLIIAVSSTVRGCLFGQ